MLVPEQGLWLGTDAQLGPPILKIIEEQPVPPPPEPQPTTYMFVELTRVEWLEQRVEWLAQRVAALEARTWTARWRRIQIWCRHVYDRFMEQ